MKKISIIGIDLAKNLFQLHGAYQDGSVAFRKRVTRGKLLYFLGKQPSCLVAMEACGGSHHWAREIRQLGHRVHILPPAYVKPFVKRHKNDMADAEAISEAASRPTMRVISVKSEDQQARAMLFRVRDLMVRQRTQTINSLRGLLAEFGLVAPKGRTNIQALEVVLEDREDSRLPGLTREMADMLMKQIREFDARIVELDRKGRAAAREDETIRRLRTIPGVGPVIGLAFLAFAPDMEDFRCGRDFAAWLGLVPLQNSSGGKARLGRVSKMGQRDLRRLLITGAMTVIQRTTRWGKEPERWLKRLLDRKPTIKAAIAVANKMARTMWALMMKGEDYRGPESRVAGIQAVGA